MKITHVCQFLGVGGLEKVLLSLAKEQVRLGHEVEVLVYDYDKRWVKHFRNNGITIIDSYQKKPGYDLGLLKWLSQKTQDAQIIHTHDLNPMLYIGVLRLFGKLKNRQRLVHTTHGMEHLQTHPKTRLYEAFLGIAAEKIVAVSPKFRSYYISQWITQQNKVHLIQNGTTVGSSCPKSPDPARKESLCAKYGLDPSKSLGIYIGRVSYLKGQLELIRFYNACERQLLIVGPAADQKYFDQCKRLCAQNVIMTGARDNIHEYLRSCDYFISSSKHEGLPIAALEAGAAGLPCALSNIPGHALFNTEEECVKLFKTTDDLEKILNFFEQMPNAETNKTFHEHIKRKFSLETMSEQYLELYKELLC